MLGAEMSESFKAYGVAGHRHLPEMLEKLHQQAGAPVDLTSKSSETKKVSVTP